MITFQYPHKKVNRVNSVQMAWLFWPIWIYIGCQGVKSQIAGGKRLNIFTFNHILQSWLFLCLIIIINTVLQLHAVWFWNPTGLCVSKIVSAVQVRNAVDIVNHRGNRQFLF